METKRAGRLNKMLSDLNRWTDKLSVEELFHFAEAANQEASNEADGLLRDVVRRFQMAKQRARQQKIFEDYQRINLSKAARKIRNILEQLNPDSLEESKEFMKIFTLGYYCGLLKALDPQFMPTDLYEVHFHSKKSGKYLKERRWDEKTRDRTELLEQIEARAREYYGGGGRKPHHDIANLFITEGTSFYHKRYKNIPSAQIRKAIGNVAEEYGCKSGIPKAKSF